MVKLTADAVVLLGNGENLKILLVRRKFPPFQGEWALPGGFIEGDEDPLQAALRELKEETGLDLSSCRGTALMLRKKQGRDPRGPVISHPFLFWLQQHDATPLANDDALIAEFVPVSSVDKLAFDHGAILLEAMAKTWALMPSYDHQYADLKLPKLFMKSKLDSDRTVFFGGSFRPWHEGHKVCLILCHEMHPDKSIIVVPDISPWKEIEVAGKNCSFLDYKNLCLELLQSPFEIYPGFWAREEVNPTVDWLPKTSSNDRALLIGDDSFLNLLEWKDANQLLRSLKSLYVVPRLRSCDENLTVKENILRLHPHIEIHLLPNHSYQNVSSTKLRSKS